MIDNEIDGEGTYGFIDGKYRVSLMANNFLGDRSVVVPGFTAKDFRLSVDATVVEASALSAVGITFRRNDEGDYYTASFSTLGFYKVSAWENDESRTIRETTASDAIRLEEGVKNNFVIEVRGPIFFLYANGQPLGFVIDPTLSQTLSQEGRVGLEMTVLGTDETLTVDFDNLVIQAIRDL